MTYRIPALAACLFALVPVTAQDIPPMPSKIAVDPSKNLVYNGGFEHPEEPAKGWMFDYRWEKNSHYMQNHTRCQVLPSYQGRKNVAHVNGKAGETKIESYPIPFTYEEGIKYRCELLLKGTTSPHIYFSGYKWKPGVRPYKEDVHIGDLRKIYKSQFRNHKITSAGGGWKKVVFEFPLDNPSRMAVKHLKYLRFVTVWIMVINDARGEIYVDNVKVTRIR